MPYVFKPGHEILQTGIYTVNHNPEHAPPHEVICRAGDHFPQCNSCHDNVRFTLVREIDEVFWNPFFARGRK